LDFEGKALLESYVIMEYAEARRVEVITHSIENVIQIGRDYGFLRWLGWGYKMMADAVAQMGDYRSALRNINKAIEIAQAPYDTELLVASLTSGIDICDETGDYSQALKMALQANLVCTQEGMTRSRLITLCDIAWILHELGADDIALEYSVEALNDAELHNAEPGLIYAVHSVLGFAHEGLGKLDDALKDFGEASRAIPSDAFRDKANSLNNTWIGEILFRQGRYHQAEVFLGGQLCVARSRGYLSTENIAEAYLGLVKFERGRYQEALYHLKGAFDRATRMGQHPIVVLCSRGLSVLYEKQGRISEALVWLQKAIAESEVMGLWQEQLSSISRFNRGLFEDYEASVPLLCKLGRIEEAFVASEKAKLISAIPILLLPEVYGSGCEVSPTGGPLDSLRREILRVRDEIGVAEGSKRLLRDLTTKIRLLSDLNRLEMTFHAVLDNVEKSTGVSSNVLDRYLLSIRELRMQSVLQPGGAILEFVVRSNTTIGLVVTRSSIQSVDLGLGRERLNELLRNASRMFQPSDVKNVFNVSSASFDTRALHVLYQTLIGPMHEALSGVSDLTIIPDDALCNFPFEILVTSFEPAMGEGKETQIRYLAENLAISYRPVAMLVRPGRSMRERNEGYLLAVGVGEGNAHQKAEGAEFYGLDRFPENSDVPRYFPGVEKEVKAIQTEFGDRCAILSGSSVSREKLVSLIGGYRCVHIAGHIEIDESHLLYSTICSSAVTEGAPSNPLRAFDLASASSHMQMFVLSGCNTARSMVEDGSEGLAGFLFCAGAHSSVGTKWPVDDESTALFMQHLYRHLREGEPKSRSLQLARLDLMRTGKSDPFYWGAFVLIGDTSPLDWQAPENTKGSKTVWLAGPMSVIVAICVVVYFRRRTGKSTCQK
jgi:CHAT domain-containing protein/tetratricopeptide (TPR) repeat protein